MRVVVAESPENAAETERFPYTYTLEPHMVGGNPGSHFLFELLEAVFDVAAGSGPPQSDFPLDFSVYATDRVALTRTTLPALRLRRSWRTIARAPLRHVAIQVVLSGGLDGSALGREIEASLGDILIADLLQPIEIQSRAEATTTLTLWIPRARLQTAVNADDVLHGMVVKGDRSAAALIGVCLKSLAAEAPRMTWRELDTLAGAAIALIARAIVPEIERLRGHAAAATVTLNAVRDFIAQNLLSGDLEAELIARNFGMSRASLYRLFEPIGGVSRYIRRQRLDRTFQELTAADYANKGVAWVARRYGFRNPSAYARLFRSTYGLTPKAVRRAALGAYPMANERPQSGGPAPRHWLQWLQA